MKNGKAKEQKDWFRRPGKSEREREIKREAEDRTRES